MTSTRIVQYVIDFSALVLIIRLISFRVKLQNVYLVFCVFLGFQLLDSLVSLLEFALRDRNFVDYRLSWMAFRVGSWAVSLWMVYALLSAILQSLPGILRGSRIVLNAIFSLALLVAILSASPEFSAVGIKKFPDPIDRMLLSWYVFDRVISMAAILALVVIIGFVLWFPVQMPKNLALFSVGFLVYFGAKTALRLMRSYVSHDSLIFFSNGIGLVLAACLVYWFVSIKPASQNVQVRLGHSWEVEEQKRLIGQLESMNAALLRSSRR
jgi:hypothetical protein